MIIMVDFGLSCVFKLPYRFDILYVFWHAATVCTQCDDKICFKEIGLLMLV